MNDLGLSNTFSLGTYIINRTEAERERVRTHWDTCRITSLARARARLLLILHWPKVPGLVDHPVLVTIISNQVHGHQLKCANGTGVFSKVSIFVSKTSLRFFSPWLEPELEHMASSIIDCWNKPWSDWLSCWVAQTHCTNDDAHSAQNLNHDSHTKTENLLNGGPIPVLSVRCGEPN